MFLIIVAQNLKCKKENYQYATNDYINREDIINGRMYN